MTPLPDHHWVTKGSKREKRSGPRPVWAVTFSVYDAKTGKGNGRDWKNIYMMTRAELAVAWMHLEHNLAKAAKRLAVYQIARNEERKRDKRAGVINLSWTNVEMKLANIKRDMRVWVGKQKLISAYIPHVEQRDIIEIFPAKSSCPVKPLRRKASGRKKPKETQMAELTEYDQKIINAFQAVCEQNKAKTPPGASPEEVCRYMSERKELAPMDTVIDIADQMKALRNRGVL